MQETHIVLKTALPAWALLLLACALAGLVIWAYGRTTRAVSPRMKALFIGLRMAAIAALFLCLIRPAMETTTYTVEKQPLVVLLDESRSMTQIADAPGGKSRLDAIRQTFEENQGALEKLREKYDVRQLSFARELLGSRESDKFSVNFSAYGRSLQQAIEQEPPGQTAGIIMIGDGSHNLGPPDPLDAAVMLNGDVPLYTVGVGREQPGAATRDIKVIGLDAPRTAYVFGTFTVRSHVLFQGCSGLTVQVRMEFPDNTFQFRTIVVAHDEEVVPVDFEAAPQEVGEFKLTVRAEQAENEILTENNVRSTFVRVVSSGLRVGYFESLRPEGKFVFRALQGAPQTNVQRIIVAPGEQLSPQDTDWKRYDVIVMGDVSPLAIGPGPLEALKKAVQDDGRGLVLMAAEQNSGVRGFKGTVLEDVLPVSLTAVWDCASGERSFLVEPRYAGHPILSLASSEPETLARWKNMAPLTSVLKGVKPRRAAEVLAADQDKNPIVCVQRPGTGRVACVLTDTTFRWFFTESQTQDDYRRFWRQVVLWAGGMDQKPEEKFWITLDKAQVGVGEPVVIQAHVATPGGEPIRDAKVAIKVLTPKGETQDLQGLFSRDQGCFKADCVPAEIGQYTVRAQATRGDKSAGTDAAFFQAFSSDRELENPIADLSLLRRMAAATSEAGGNYCYYTDLSHLLDDLAARGEPLRLRTSQWNEVWDTQWLFLAFAVAVALEWGLRKWKGLV